eukprot:28794_3
MMKIACMFVCSFSNSIQAVASSSQLRAKEVPKVAPNEPPGSQRVFIALWQGPPQPLCTGAEQPPMVRTPWVCMRRTLLARNLLDRVQQTPQVCAAAPTYRAWFGRCSLHPCLCKSRVGHAWMGEMHPNDPGDYTCRGECPSGRTLPMPLACVPPPLLKTKKSRSAAHSFVLSL